MALNNQQIYEGQPGIPATGSDIFSRLGEDIVLPAPGEAIDAADLDPRVGVASQAAINATRLMKSLVTA